MKNISFNPAEERYTFEKVPNCPQSVIRDNLKFFSFHRQI